MTVTVSGLTRAAAVAAIAAGTIFIGVQVGRPLLALGYLSIMCTTFIGAFVAPTIADTAPVQPAAV